MHITKYRKFNRSLFAYVYLLLFSALVIVSFIFYHEKHIHKPMPFISYWFSWAQNNPNYILPQLNEIPNGVNIVLIAFALEKPDHSGLTLQLNDNEQFAKDVLNLEHRGTQVNLSTGGESGAYPWQDETLNDKEIANQYLEFTKLYHLQGIDFDIEKGKGKRIPNIVKLIKKANPKLMITLTVASAGRDGVLPNMANLFNILYQQHTLDYLILMNYNQYKYWALDGCSYESNNLATNCYIQNTLATEQLLIKITHNENIKRLLVNGIMIGFANDGKIMTLEQSKSITQWLKLHDYSGIMTWGLNRDQSTMAWGKNIETSTGLVGLPTLAFTHGITNILK